MFAVTRIHTLFKEKRCGGVSQAARLISHAEHGTSFEMTQL